MGKRKSSSMTAEGDNPGGQKKRGRTAGSGSAWTAEQDAFLAGLMLHKGKKGWKAIGEEFNAHFKATPKTVEAVKLHWNIKKRDEQELPEEEVRHIYI